MREFSEVYQKSCNAGNELSGVIKATSMHASLHLAAQEAQKATVHLIDLIAEQARFDQAEELKQTRLAVA